MNPKVLIKGVEKTLRGIKQAEIQQLRNINTAFRVEGFKMKNELQQQIRDGSPGGFRWDPLTQLARRWFGRRKNNPLHKLARGIRYHVPNTPVPTLQVGFVGPVNARQHALMVRSGIKLGSHGGYRGVAVGGMTSNSWRRLGRQHQKGFEKPITESQRSWLFKKANSMRRSNPARRVFILKPTTTTFKTPPRLIIDPFWNARRAHTIRNIRENYHRKMRGVKI